MDTNSPSLSPPPLSRPDLSGAVTYSLLGLLLSMLLWEWWWRRAAAASGSSLPLPPGFMGLPFVGLTLFTPLEPLVGGNVFSTLYWLFGPIYRIFVIGKPVIRLAEPEACKKVFGSVYMTPVWPDTVRALLGTRGALSQLHGADHKLHRRALQRAFTRDALDGYTGPLHAACTHAIRGWVERGAAVNVFTESKVLAFKSAWRLFVGMDLAGDDAVTLTRTFMDFVNGFVSVPIYLPGTTYYKAVKARVSCHRFVLQAINRVRRGEVDQEWGALHLILSGEETRDMDDEELCESVVELLFAGHETISSVMTSTVMHLARNPETLAKFREELKAHHMEVPGEPFSSKQLSQLEYGHNIVQEVLRISPPIQGVFRTVDSTFTVMGYQVPAGWSVMAGIMEMHKLNQFYPDPEHFDPDRWSRITDPVKIRNNFVPFGGGSHMCLGKDYSRLFSIIFLVEIARSCEWTVANKNPACTYIPSFRPKDGLPTKFYLKESNIAQNGL